MEARDESGVGWIILSLEVAHFENISEHYEKRACEGEVIEYSLEIDYVLIRGGVFPGVAHFDPAPHCFE